MPRRATMSPRMPAPISSRKAGVIVKRSPPLRPALRFWPSWRSWPSGPCAGNGWAVVRLPGTRWPCSARFWLIRWPAGLPGCPARPELRSHLDVPKRSPFTPQGLAALLHAVTHIEFNAILAKLKEDQAEKEANYQYFRSVFKHLSIGLITFGENGEIQILNVAAKRILNVDELKNISEIEQVNKELHLAIQNLRTGGSELIKIAHPDGIMQLSVYVIELLMRGERFKLVSLQNIQSELEEKEMEAWQNLVKILTHEIMNSIAPISSSSVL